VVVCEFSSCFELFRSDSLAERVELKRRLVRCPEGSSILTDGTASLAKVGTEFCDGCADREDFPVDTFLKQSPLFLNSRERLLALFKMELCEYCVRFVSLIEGRVPIELKCLEIESHVTI